MVVADGTSFGSVPGIIQLSDSPTDPPHKLPIMPSAAIRLYRSTLRELRLNVSCSCSDGAAAHATAPDRLSILSVCAPSRTLFIAMSNTARPVQSSVICGPCSCRPARISARTLRRSNSSSLLLFSERTGCIRYGGLSVIRERRLELSTSFFSFRPSSSGTMAGWT